MTKTKKNLASRPSVRSVGGSRTADLKAIPSISVVEQVVDSIRDEIRARRLAPGQRLIESDIRTTIGASRASIREAMGRLEAEGLVEITHQKGARVRRVTVEDAENINDIREAVEGVAARLAAENIGKGDYKNRLRALERDFIENNDSLPMTYLRYNENFHNLIVEMSENWRLRRVVEQLQHATFLMLSQVVSNRDVMARTHGEHKLIVAAVLKGDGAKAERAMRSHIRRTGRDVVSIIEKFLK